jgi:alkanesulfonate monooxygenase SsuD/methylene tetrahydromethanopterin reductase-like flavin-dependent oxidoreductase (luciferase family)
MTRGSVTRPSLTRVAITLPSFRESPEPAIEMARAAEAAGLDAVFAFDHLFRTGPSGRRPAIEAFTLLGAVAAETERVALGPLVARATLRPPATLAHMFDTVQRVSHGRLIAAIGAGDEESRVENETFGLEFATMADRIAVLGDTLEATMGHGYPVWVGGTAAAVRAVAARADGWNRWGGDPSRLAAGAREIRSLAHAHPCVVSWGGLVVLGADEAAAQRKRDRLDPPPDAIVGGPERVAERLREYIAAGADWVIAGPVDSGDLDNPAILGERIVPLLA